MIHRLHTGFYVFLPINLFSLGEKKVKKKKEKGCFLAYLLPSAFVQVQVVYFKWLKSQFSRANSIIEYDNQNNSIRKTKVYSVVSSREWLLEFL